MPCAILVPAAPHYANVRGNEQIWFGRIFAAIKLARDLNVPLIIVGDANGGADNAQFEALAAASGVEVYVEQNGSAKEYKNTRGDMRAAARALRDQSTLHAIDEIILVTCWYHCLRAHVELHRALLDVLPERDVRQRVEPVWDKFLHGLWRLLRPDGEIRGIIDALRNRPHTVRGQLSHSGKPDFR
jgi:hypothetical protein